MGEMKYWFQGIGYEERFDPGEVSPTQIYKRQTILMLFLVQLVRRRWGRFLVRAKSLCFFLTCVIGFWRQNGKYKQVEVVSHTWKCLGIQVVVNTGTSSFSPAPLSINIIYKAPYLTMTIDISASSLKVDQLVDTATTLNVEESNSSPISTKRPRDDEK